MTNADEIKKLKDLLDEGVITEEEYENKKKASELLNPINFFLWLIFSLKDIF